MPKSNRDWTCNSRGRSNSSVEFLSVIAVIERIIRNSGPDLVNGRAEVVARVIAARLAHELKLAPTRRALRGQR